MVLADHVFMLWLMTGHMPLEVASFVVQELLADMTVHLVLARVTGHVVVANLLVHESLVAARVVALERSIRIGEVCQMLLRDVAG